jgi:NitT/TauT family transport system ATP-binding protein
MIATGTNPHVVLDRVSYRFPDSNVQAIETISLSAAAGETVVLLGPSGCGKTTILRLIAGLLTPESGTVTIADAAPKVGQGTAMVFQSFRLLPWKTTRDNIVFALHHLPTEQRAERANRYIALVGLERFADAYPGQLSGGMKQRVALARALAAEPDVLLMDEPFASLDAQSRELMQIELGNLTRGAARPATTFFVTHSVDEALMLADRIVLLSPRPGRVAEVLDVTLPEQRWRADTRQLPEFIAMRQHLWDRLREMVLADPNSDFYGRMPKGDAA